MAEGKVEMAREVEKNEKSYYLHHRKLDVVADVIAKQVEYNTTYSTKLDAKTQTES